MIMRRLRTIMILCLLPWLTLTARRGGEAHREYITYEEFGAKGDGVHDDQAAIVAAHKRANELGLPVRASDSKTYYIGRGSEVAVIQTDVDFGEAHFIIDDVVTDLISAPIFRVESAEKPVEITGVSRLEKEQKSLGVSLPARSLVLVENSKRKVYIRYGLNQDNGTPQKEVFIADRKGKVDRSSPIIWDYEEITRMTAYPIDKRTLTIRGGYFTTLANQAESKYNYYGRGIVINRSNVRVERITHWVKGEKEHGAPYSGFLEFDRCADVVVTGCLLTPHKTYTTIGSAGKPVSMGSYDMNAGYCVNLRIEHGRQTIDIDDRAYWGLFASNFCKGLCMDDMVISRFDAHMGVANVTLTGCTFGYMGIQAVGFGTMLIKDCEMHRNTFIWLRDDYGSTWDGDVIIKDCTFKPVRDERSLTLISGSNSGTHDFGYPCYLPRRICVENLTIDDSAIKNESYAGPTILSDFHRNASAQNLLPYPATEEVVLKNVRVASGKPLKLAPDAQLFKETKMRTKGKRAK